MANTTAAPVISVY